MNELALFAGAGGGILGGLPLGFRTVCAVEIERSARDILFRRQRDGLLPKFPIWDDVRTFAGGPWRGKIDIITGGFPCTDISPAGKGAGIAGENSGLWKEFARIIGEVRPTFALIENSSALRTRGLDVVLKDLDNLGYNARWGVLGAGDCGAPHTRKRMWVLAYLNSGRPEEVLREQREHREAASGWQGDINGSGRAEGGYWPAEPGVGRVAYGVAHRLDRIKALGNGQIPRVVQAAWDILLSAGL